ncbi:MAG TPA: hypothetical protein VFB38_19970 [Chthonomonadaceae bacterium]|nr:hypothetical protein [Chthonomonadaceae bacterium]
MLMTYRLAAAVRNASARSTFLGAFTLGLLALIAAGLSAPARADQAATILPSTPATDMARIIAPARWHKAVRPEEATRVASTPDILRGTAPTIQEAVLSQKLALNALTRSAAAGGGGGGGQVVPPSIFPLSIRLGAVVSPRTKFTGGVDYMLPASVSIGQYWHTRLDAEAIASFNFGGISTLFPITINELYSRGITAGPVGGVRFYGGAGIGAYIGEVTRFGGKVFIGGDISDRLGVEMDLHFPGFGDPLLAILARFRL